MDIKERITRLETQMENQTKILNEVKDLCLETSKNFTRIDRDIAKAKGIMGIVSVVAALIMDFLTDLFK